MFLKNGDYIRASDIVYLSQVQTIKGKRQWDITLTKEIITEDRFFISIKLAAHTLTLEYDNKNEALEDYNNIFLRLQKD